MDLMAILAAALSGAVSLVVCLINNHFQASKTAALISYRLDQLEHKVDKIDQDAERLARLEKQLARMEDEINRHKERIHILEDDHK